MEREGQPDFIASAAPRPLKPRPNNLRSFQCAFFSEPPGKPLAQHGCRQLLPPAVQLVLPVQPVQFLTQKNLRAQRMRIGHKWRDAVVFAMRF